MRYYMSPRRYTLANVYRRNLLSNYLAKTSAIKRRSWITRHKGLIALHGAMLGVPLMADSAMFAV
jgi:hypothetical protein